MTETTVKQAIVIWHFIDQQWCKEGEPKRQWFKTARKILKKHLSYLKDSTDAWDETQYELLSKDLEDARDESVIRDTSIKVQVHVFIKGNDEKLNPQGKPLPDYYQQVLEQLMR